MYEIAVTLGEPIEDKLVLQQGDSPLLELTAYDYDGTALDTGYTGTLYVGRSGSDPDEWILAELDRVPAVDNIFIFQLDEITYSRGNYQAFLLVENRLESTPTATPEDVSYSYKNISIEVV